MSNPNYDLAKEIEADMTPIAMKIVRLGFALDGDDKFRIEQARNMYYTSARIIRDVRDRLREGQDDSTDDQGHGVLGDGMMTKQRTRSICVKTWEAKALHDGRLSVLLRPVKLDLGHHEYVEVNSDDPSNLVREYHYGGVTRSTYVECPFGIVGDELACKESYARRDDFDWRADKEKTLHYLRLKSQYEGDLGNEWHWYGDWRPASTMPLWMCRLHRTIASVRVVKPCDLTRSEIAATAANAWLESLDGRAYDNAEKTAYRHTKSINPDATAVERCGILRACLDSTWGEGLWDREFWAIGFKEVEK